MSANMEIDDDFGRIVDHVLNADPNLLGKVTAGDTELVMEANDDADITEFQQAVRVATRSAPEEDEHEVAFDDTVARVRLA